MGELVIEITRVCVLIGKPIASMHEMKSVRNLEGLD